MLAAAVPVAVYVGLLVEPGVFVSGPLGDGDGARGLIDAEDVEETEAPVESVADGDDVLVVVVVPSGLLPDDEVGVIGPVPLVVTVEVAVPTADKLGVTDGVAYAVLLALTVAEGGRDGDVDARTLDADGVETDEGDSGIDPLGDTLIVIDGVDAAAHEVL
jgi:hypothetical protein